MKDIIVLDVNIQTCIVHQIRNSIKYIASKNQREFSKNTHTKYVKESIVSIPEV